MDYANNFVKLNNKGFTLIEILIVVAIGVFLVILTLPLGINFYRTQQLDSAAGETVQALRRAQLNAMSVKDDSAFGVYFGSGQTGQYVLFRGNSYSVRTDEEVFDIVDDIVFGGISEVVFSRLDGIPDAVGNITLTLGADTKTVNINTAGRINLE